MRSLARPADLADLVARLRRLRPDSRRRWGSMSAGGMVCHLTDALRLPDGGPRARDRSTLLSRTLVKWLALYTPLRWPPGIPTTPELDQRTGGTPPADFAGDVERLAALFAQVAGDAGRLHGRRHPVFGPLSGRAWLRWAYLHADHHLRQFGA